MYCARTDRWYLERAIWLVAGVITLGSAALSAFVSPYWLILTALVGVNLIVFALSGFCVMANLLVKLGLRSAVAPSA
ncbi:MAG: DUF2892 domain-containing protein [Leptospirales bacterium]|nr:DUF2892 domain-containing protein [Leptospirales bacterium]